MKNIFNYKNTLKIKKVKTMQNKSFIFKFFMYNMNFMFGNHCFRTIRKKFYLNLGSCSG